MTNEKGHTIYALGPFFIDPDMSEEKLEDDKFQLEADMVRIATEQVTIKGQIEEAQEKMRRGEEVDRSWLRRTRDAGRHRKVAYQARQRALGEVNRLLRERRHAENNSRFERQFIIAAKRLLPEEVYQRIVQEAGAAILPKS